MEKKVCKFDIQDLLPIGLTIVVLGIGLAYGMNVVGDLRDDFCTSGTPGGGNCYSCSHDTVHPTFNSSDLLCHNATDGTSASSIAVGDGDVNASVKAVEGISKIPEKLPLIVTVIVAAVIIGILIRYLMVRYT